VACVLVITPGKSDRLTGALATGQRVDLALEPCPCVQAHGIAGRYVSQLWLERTIPPA
jgi:hypothetical protein